MGGRFSGLAQALNTVAERLRSQREAGEEQGRKINLLGIEGLIKGKLLEKEAEIKDKYEPKTQPIVDRAGKIIGYRPEGAVFQPQSLGFWDEETGEVTPTTPPAPKPAPGLNFLSPLFQPSKFKRVGLFKYEPKSAEGASYGGDKRSAYNALRSRGISEKEAKKRLSLQ